LLLQAHLRAVVVVLLLVAAARGGAAAMRGGPGLARERLMGSGAVAFAAQRFQPRARAGGGRSNAALTFSIGAGGAAARFCRGRSFARRPQLHSGAPGFGQSDGDGLFGGTGAVFAFANVVHFFADEFTGLS